MYSIYFKEQKSYFDIISIAFEINLKVFHIKYKMWTNVYSNILNNLSNHLINNIKIIYVFGYKVTQVLIVTIDEKCYGFGQNSFAVLGLGHNRQVKEPKIIEELCYKQIISFANGLYDVMAL